MSLSLKLGFGALIAATLSIGPANSQPFAIVTCVTTTVVPLVRGESLAELVGDVRAQCTLPAGMEPPSGYLTANFVVGLNTNITNRLDFGHGADIADAILVINENNFAFPAATSTFSGSAPDPDVPIPQYGRYGMFGSTARLDWGPVQVPYPGGCRPGRVCTVGDLSDPDRFPLVTQLRWTNIRANVAQLGVPPPGTFPTTFITGGVALTTNAPLTFITNSITAGATIRGLQASTRLSAAGALFDVRLEELFATAFKPLGVTSTSPISQTRAFEAGYCSPGSGSAPPGDPVPGGICMGGGATQGTRFRLAFPGAMPNQILVPGSVTGTGGLELTRVGGASEDGSGGTLAPTSKLEPLDGKKDAGFVIYEVTNADPSQNELADVPVSTRGSNGRGMGKAKKVGDLAVEVSLVPVGASLVADRDSLIPRYAEGAGWSLSAPPPEILP